MTVVAHHNRRTARLHAVPASTSAESAELHFGELASRLLGTPIVPLTVRRSRLHLGHLVIVGLLVGDDEDAVVRTGSGTASERQVAEAIAVTAALGGDLELASGVLTHLVDRGAARAAGVTGAEERWFGEEALIGRLRDLTAVVPDSGSIAVGTAGGTFQAERCHGLCVIVAPASAADGGSTEERLRDLRVLLDAANGALT